MYRVSSWWTGDPSSVPDSASDFLRDLGEMLAVPPKDTGRELT